MGPGPNVGLRGNWRVGGGQVHTKHTHKLPTNNSEWPSNICACVCRVHQSHKAHKRSAQPGHITQCHTRRARRQQVAQQQGSSARPAWNHAEFAVAYPSLARHLCIGGIYVRLLLEGHDTGGCWLLCI